MYLLHKFIIVQNNVQLSLKAVIVSKDHEPLILQDVNDSLSILSV